MSQVNIEKTLVLLKPDAVKRGLMGEIISRFEKAGLKIVALKLKQIETKQAQEHYGQDIAEKWGQEVRKLLLDFIVSGPVLAMVVAGVEAVENVRMMVGATEPKAAQPGTIRGDYSHTSYKHANNNGKAVANVIHASADKKEAEREIYLWFNEDEFCHYKSVHEKYTL